MHFKSKLLAIGKVFFFSNSVYIKYNDYFIWLSSLFLSYYIQWRLKGLSVQCEWPSQILLFIEITWLFLDLVPVLKFSTGMQKVRHHFLHGFGDFLTALHQPYHNLSHFDYLFTAAYYVVGNSFCRGKLKNLGTENKLFKVLALSPLESNLFHYLFSNII